MVVGKSSVFWGRWMSCVLRSDSEAMCECEVPQRSHLGNSMGKSEVALGQSLIQLLKMISNLLSGLLFAWQLIQMKSLGRFYFFFLFYFFYMLELVGKKKNK